MKNATMTFYFDLNHPTKLLTALGLVYSLEKGNQPTFKHYSSSEYENVSPQSIFFFVDEEKDGLELNTRRMAEEGFTVFAIKFPQGKAYVPFDVAEAILKMWSRVIRFVNTQREPLIYKYSYQADRLKPVNINAV